MDKIIAYLKAKALKYGSNPKIDELIKELTTNADELYREHLADGKSWDDAERLVFESLEGIDSLFMQYAQTTDGEEYSKDIQKPSCNIKAIIKERIKKQLGSDIFGFATALLLTLNGVLISFFLGWALKGMIGHSLYFWTHENANIRFQVNLQLPIILFSPLLSVAGVSLMLKKRSLFLAAVSLILSSVQTLLLILLMFPYLSNLYISFLITSAGTTIVCAFNLLKTIKALKNGAKEIEVTNNKSFNKTTAACVAIVGAILSIILFSAFISFFKIVLNTFIETSPNRHREENGPYVINMLSFYYPFLISLFVTVWSLFKFFRSKKPSSETRKSLTENTKFFTHLKDLAYYKVKDVFYYGKLKKITGILLIISGVMVSLLSAGIIAVMISEGGLKGEDFKRTQIMSMLLLTFVLLTPLSLSIGAALCRAKHPKSLSVYAVILNILALLGMPLIISGHFIETRVYNRDFYIIIILLSGAFMLCALSFAASIANYFSTQKTPETTYINNDTQNKDKYFNKLRSTCILIIGSIISAILLFFVIYFISNLCDLLFDPYYGHSEEMGRLIYAVLIFYYPAVISASLAIKSALFLKNISTPITE